METQRQPSKQGKLRRGHWLAIALMLFASMVIQPGTAQAQLNGNGWFIELELTYVVEDDDGGSRDEHSYGASHHHLLVSDGASFTIGDIDLCADAEARLQGTVTARTDDTGRLLVTSDTTASNGCNANPAQVAHNVVSKEFDLQNIDPEEALFLGTTAVDDGVNEVWMRIHNAERVDVANTTKTYVEVKTNAFAFDWEFIGDEMAEGTALGRVALEPGETRDVVRLNVCAGANVRGVVTSSVSMAFDETITLLTSLSLHEGSCAERFPDDSARHIDELQLFQTNEVQYRLTNVSDANDDDWVTGTIAAHAYELEGTNVERELELADYQLTPPPDLPVLISPFRTGLTNPFGINPTMDPPEITLFGTPFDWDESG